MRGSQLGLAKLVNVGLDNWTAARAIIATNGSML